MAWNDKFPQPIPTDKDQLRRLGLLISDDRTEPHFTGWKDLPNEEGASIGQIVQWLPGKRAAYVNLPGMESGIVPMGACIDIGVKRQKEIPSAEEMERMLVEGLEKLKTLVALTGVA